MKKQAIKPKVQHKAKFNIGNISFLLILLISIVTAIFTVDQLMTLLVLTILGALIAIENIKKNEEKSFLISITALIIIALLFSLANFSDVMSVYAETFIKKFLVNISLAFGVGGFIVSLGKIMKLSWN